MQIRGLDVRLINYVELGREFDGKFDAVIANGSIEHFVQPADALAGQAEVMYTRLFRILHRVLDPLSPLRRVATTVIHFARCPGPRALVSSPSQYVRGSDNYHYALLARSFGGCYPTIGQLEQCPGIFLTCPGRRRHRRLSVDERTVACARAGDDSQPARTEDPGRDLAADTAAPGPQFATMVQCVLLAESWNWQFRGPNPPTRLLRHTWQYCPHSIRRTKCNLPATITYRPYSDATKQASATAV